MIIKGLTKSEISRAGQQADKLGKVSIFAVVRQNSFFVAHQVCDLKVFNGLNELHPHYKSNCLCLKSTDCKY